jgi:nicotinamidase-related amidase
LVDAQEAFLKAIPDLDEVIHNAGILAQAAAILSVPVLATTQNRSRLGEIAEPLRSQLPAGVPIVDKLCFSCAGSEELIEALAQHGRKQVLICGVETHICVNQTAHDLMQRGYDVHVVADAVGSRRESHRELALRRMERSGAIITTTESALYEMLIEAGTPEFRSILGLIK